MVVVAEAVGLAVVAGLMYFVAWLRRCYVEQFPRLEAAASARQLCAPT